jgi:peptidoglycan/LPS O-acetylase OafA/YrhL
MGAHAATGSTSRLDRLEMARGVAATLIVLFHATAIVQTPAYLGVPPLGGIFSAGGFGVDFFFVLSGFIIMHVHARDLGVPGRIGPYLRKRITRIYPPFWAALAFVVPVYFLKPDFGDGTETNPARLLTSILLLPFPEAPVLPVAWSLRHEVLFYAAFGMAVWRPRIGWTLLIAWQASVVAWHLRPVHTNFLVAWLLDLRNLDFALGMACAWILARRRETLLDRCAATPLAAGGALVLGAAAAGRHFGHFNLPDDLYTLLYGLCSSMIVVGLALLDLRSRHRGPAWMRPFGEASYSVYLTHYPLLSAIAKLGRLLGLNHTLGSELLLVLLSVTAISGGILFHYTVERPVLAFVRRRWPASPPPSPPFAGPDAARAT